jgi:hypothetical protein
MGITSCGKAAGGSASSFSWVAQEPARWLGLRAEVDDLDVR